MKKTIMSVALSTSVMAGSASASTLTELFSSFWVLGDSLSAFAGPVGGEDTARASNGALWSEQIISDFEAVGRQAQSYAVGGATAGLAGPRDLAAQTERLVAEQNNDFDPSLDNLDKDALVAIWIGGNDVGAFQAGLSPFTSRTAYASSLSALVDAGVRNFLLFEVPNVGFTPLVRSGPEGVPTEETLFNSAIAAGAA
ncbi:MAG: SGNH/GDSL hydrolase family protein, partial [Roseobacter sp.]|nr:SGNH/GDSL hydrolase family protein [Roseobacter sp.]